MWVNECECACAVSIADLFCLLSSLLVAGEWLKKLRFSMKTAGLSFHQDRIANCWRTGGWWGAIGFMWGTLGGKQSNLTDLRLSRKAEGPPPCDSEGRAPAKEGPELPSHIDLFWNPASPWLCALAHVWADSASRAINGNNKSPCRKSFVTRAHKTLRQGRHKKPNKYYWWWLLWCLLGFSAATPVRLVFLAPLTCNNPGRGWVRFTPLAKAHRWRPAGYASLGLGLCACSLMLRSRLQLEKTHGGLGRSEIRTSPPHTDSSGPTARMPTPVQSRHYLRTAGH